ncbi:hypothetical protein [Natronolimnohabitans innermongolicus]|uniref:hypothetical protein n=1 Tax=Natronolimnohabitans innermongolicus TaxID=253107 RepID=UPI0013756E96|nr:hypothetical protein [Natronolimnohabitans innermongolicus]
MATSFATATNNVPADGSNPAADFATSRLRPRRQLFPLGGLERHSTYFQQCSHFERIGQ